MMREALLATTFLAGAIGMEAAEPVHTSVFTAGKWNPEDWQIVKSWRWDYIGGWTQKDNCIENKYPAGATNAEMLGGKAGETYTPMLLKKEFSGNHIISCDMEFDDRMAPGIMITIDPPAEDAKKRPELRDHIEVILWDQGINIWHHFFVNGKQQWTKSAYLATAFKPKTRYRMTVAIKNTHRGAELSVKIGDHLFGAIMPVIPKNYRVGLVGCEGVNRFYDFVVTPGKL